PFPLKALRAALQNARRVVVAEKYLAPGLGGILASNIRMALRGLDIPVDTVVCGLGGRSIPKASIIEMLLQAHLGPLEEPHFLDMSGDAIKRQRNRQRAARRSGPTAENVMFDVLSNIPNEDDHVQLGLPAGR